ncbi:hypothetical protein EHM69_05005, partial [candidate division KSB1 bacterium]
MKVTFWTFAQNGRLPDSFPRLHVPLLLAGADAHQADSLKSNPDNFAACLNEAAERAHEGLLVFAPPDLSGLAEGWRDRLVHAARENENGVFFYGDYLLDGPQGRVLQTVRADIGDITEREDWGPLWAVRISRFREFGGLDEKTPRAAFYDLLLKCWGSGRRIHVGGPLAVIPAPERDEDAEREQRKLF